MEKETLTNKSECSVSEHVARDGLPPVGKFKGIVARDVAWSQKELWVKAAFGGIFGVKHHSIKAVKPPRGELDLLRQLWGLFNCTKENDKPEIVHGSWKQLKEQILFMGNPECVCGGMQGLEHAAEARCAFCCLKAVEAGEDDMALNVGFKDEVVLIDRLRILDEPEIDVNLDNIDEKFREEFGLDDDSELLELMTKDISFQNSSKERTRAKCTLSAEETERLIENGEESCIKVIWAARAVPDTLFLHVAVAAGDIVFVKQEVSKMHQKRDSLVCSRDSKLRTALMAAAKWGRPAIADLLLSAEAGLIDANEETAIVHAFVENNWQAMNVLLKSQLERELLEITNLMVAAYHGDLNEVKQFAWQAGRTDRYFHTAIHFAAAGGHLPIVKFLIEKEADILNWLDWNVLTYAVFNYRLEIVRWYLHYTGQFRLLALPDEVLIAKEFLRNYLSANRHYRYMYLRHVRQNPLKIQVFQGNLFEIALMCPQGLYILLNSHRILELPEKKFCLSHVKTDQQMAAALAKYYTEELQQVFQDQTSSSVTQTPCIETVVTVLKPIAVRKRKNSHVLFQKNYLSAASCQCICNQKSSSLIQAIKGSCPLCVLKFLGQIDIGQPLHTALQIGERKMTKENEQIVRLLSNFPAARAREGVTMLMLHAYLSEEQQALCFLHQKAQQSRGGFYALLFAGRRNLVDLARRISYHEIGFVYGGLTLKELSDTLSQDVVRIFKDSPLLSKMFSLTQKSYALRQGWPGAKRVMGALLQDPAVIEDESNEIFGYSDEESSSTMQSQKSSIFCDRVSLMEQRVSDFIERQTRQSTFFAIRQRMEQSKFQMTRMVVSSGIHVVQMARQRKLFSYAGQFVNQRARGRLLAQKQAQLRELLADVALVLK